MNNQEIQLVGRTLLASLFIITSAKSALFDFKGFEGAVRSKGIPLPTLVAVLALSLKFFGGISIMLDKYSILASIGLVIFTILATVIYHNALKDPSQLNSMLKNLSIIGGLILFIGIKMNS